MALFGVDMESSTIARQASGVPTTIWAEFSDDAMLVLAKQLAELGLARGRIDMALTILRDNQTRFEAQPILTEGYALALSRRHRLADRASIAPEELIGETMLVRRQCEALPETSRFFTARGIRPFFAARTADESRAIAYVRCGMGITVMPECFTDPGIARPWLDGFTLTRRIGLLFADHASARRLREPARLLADALSDEAQD